MKLECKTLRSRRWVEYCEDGKSLGAAVKKTAAKDMALCGGFPAEVAFDFVVPCDRMHRSTHRWRLFFGAFLLASLVAIGLVMLAMAQLHEEIAEPFLMHVDSHVQAAIHGEASPGLTGLMFALTWIGSPKILFPLVPLIGALFWWRRLRQEALVLMVAMAGAGALNTLLKMHFRRVRPDIPWAFVHEHSFSFPSGHSVYAVVLYGTLAYLGMRYLRPLGWRVAIVLAAAGLILGIGFSRIYLGAHYPSDVAAGYLVGSIWLIAVIGSDWTVRRTERRNGTA